MPKAQLPSPLEVQGAVVLSRTLRRYEARSEMLADGILIGVYLLVVALATFDRSHMSSGYYYGFVAIYLGTSVFLGLALAIAAAGHQRRWMKYVTVGVQISSITASMIFDVEFDANVKFIFGPVLMMGYCVVIGLTAFRLSARLPLFAGVLACLQILAVEFFLVKPLIWDSADQELMDEYGMYFLFVSVVLILVMGVASSLAASNVLRTLRQQIGEAMRRQQTEFLFGRYVSPEVAEAVLRQQGGKVMPELAQAAILFCDIKGFTAFSAGKSPAEVVGLIEKCWSHACDIVDEEQGVVNKFLGDGLMVLFGVPVRQPDFTVCAAKTGLRLSRELDEILKPYGLHLCVGIHTGEVIAGEIGPGSRCEYTVIGDAVNLASRLERLTRSVDCRIVISRSMKDALPPDFKVRDLGPKPIPGITAPVEVFELAG